MQKMNKHSEEVRIPVADAVLAGTLLVPQCRWPCPAIVLVSGSGANDRDETVCGHTPFRIIAEYFCARDYIVLRCDDRGVGDSTGETESQDFDGSVLDVCEMCRWLAEHPAVDERRIFLLGHSEGGLIATLAGQKFGAMGVVM